MGPQLTSASPSEQLLETLRARLTMMRPHERLRPERELAEEFGVSYSTVRRVTGVLEQEGYIYKVQGKGTFVAARASETGRRTGIIYADVWRVDGNQFFMRMLQGILDEADRRECDLHLFQCQRHAIHEEEQQRVVELAERTRAGGLLLPWVHAPMAAWLRSRCPELRIVSQTTRYPAPGVSTVMLDYAALGYQAAHYLLEHGCRRIGCIASQHYTLQGLEDVRQEPAGTAPEFDALELSVPMGRIQSMPELVDRLLEFAPDGLAIDDDRMARRCLQALQDRKPDFLDRCAVVSQANQGEEILPPQVNRLVVDAYEIGRNAVALLDRMVREACSERLTVLVQPEIVPAAP